MGQYYYAVNLDKKEFMEAWKYNSGLKLMEHSYVGNPLMLAVETMLLNAWKGDRIVWAGDYMDEGLFIEESNKTLHEACDGKLFREVIPLSAAVIKGTGVRYIYNLDRKEYIDKTQLPRWNDDIDKIEFVVHPLSILTSSGNGRGGGDYHPQKDSEIGLIGLWSGDHITVSNELLDGFTEVRPGFDEPGW